MTKKAYPWSLEGVCLTVLECVSVAREWCRVRGVERSMGDIKQSLTQLQQSQARHGTVASQHGEQRRVDICILCRYCVDTV